jgi:hypothetical protein
MMNSISLNARHPRLQLLPLLSSGGYPNVFAHEILKLMDAALTDLSPSDEEIEVTVGEAAALVEISINTLRKWVAKRVKQGINVDFPITIKLLLAMQNQFKHDRKNKLQINQTNELLTINQTAERLSVHPEIVRSIQHKGFLKFEKKNIGGSLKAVTTEEELKFFTNRYVLVGTLARKFGINPIAGPAIDGLKTSLFNQKDAEILTKPLIESIEKCATNAGRKKKNKTPPALITQNGDSVPIVEASKVLNISVQKTKTLLQRGILKKTNTDRNGVSVTLNSLVDLQKTLGNEEYFSIQDGCKELDTTLGMLTRNWVNTGLLDVIDCYYWKFVPKKQIKEIRKIKTEYVDAAAGGKLLGVSRAHLINQERIGNINCMRIEGKKLFKISDVLTLEGINRATIA